MTGNAGPLKWSGSAPKAQLENVVRPSVCAGKRGGGKPGPVRASVTMLKRRAARNQEDQMLIFLANRIEKIRRI
jgi:hypothetical protein